MLISLGKLTTPTANSDESKVYTFGDTETGQCSLHFKYNMLAEIKKKHHHDQLLGDTLSTGLLVVLD